MRKMTHVLVVLGAFLACATYAPPILTAQNSGDGIEQRIRALENDARDLKLRVANLEQLIKPTQSVPASKAAWRSIRKGMSGNEIRALLGEPGKVMALSSFTMWYYPDAGGGSVTLTAGRVSGWSEP